MTRQQISKIVLGSDHAGLNYKQYVIRALNDEYPEIETVDIGCFTSETCDYSDFAHTVAQMVSKNTVEFRGILICGTGTGMCIMSNRYSSIKCAAAQSVFQVADARKKQDINVLSVGAQLITKTECMNMVRTFLDTEFENVDKKAKSSFIPVTSVDYNSLKPVDHNVPTDYGRLSGKSYKLKSGLFGNRNSVYPTDVVVNNTPMVIKPNNFIDHPEPESPMISTPIPEPVMVMTDELKQKQEALKDSQKKLYELLLNNKLEHSDRNMKMRDVPVPPATMDEYKKDIDAMNTELVELMQKVMNIRVLAKKVHGNLNVETNQIFNVFT